MDLETQELTYVPFVPAIVIYQPQNHYGCLLDVTKERIYCSEHEAVVL